MSACSLDQLYSLFQTSFSQRPCVAFHSDHVKKGDVFFALEGQKVNGHDFLEDVADKGASLAVISKQWQGTCPLDYVAVDDVLATLQDLAHFSLEKMATNVVGITGDMGKTTTKEFLFQLVHKRYPTEKNQGSQNTQISLPATILNLRTRPEFLILEMGMTQKGNIANLVKIASPKIAAITSLPQSWGSYIHAGAVNSYEEIIEGKMQILQTTEKAIIPHGFVTSHSHVETFSLSDREAHFFAQVSPGQLDLYYKGSPVGSFSLRIPKHHYSNACVAIILAHYMGLSFEEIAGITESLCLPTMRFETIEKNGITIINDAYNASPVAYAKAIETIQEHPGRKIAVLGNMGDLGVHYTKKAHEELLEKANKVFEKGYLYGNLWDSEHGSDFCLKEDKNQIIEELLSELQEGDLLFIKGSRVFKLEEVFEGVVGRL